MASRKDLMQVLRRDADFSAKLEFGALGGTTNSAEKDPGKGGKQLPLSDSNLSDGSASAERAERNAARAFRRTDTSGLRTTRVYVAVSLTRAQSARAEAWAQLVGCSVPFLIRRLCHAVRKEAFDLWSQGKLSSAERETDKRGWHPTSVTLTLSADLARNLTSEFDPTGLLGLARVVSPSFRALFDKHFDAAAKSAGF